MQIQYLRGRRGYRCVPEGTGLPRLLCINSFQSTLAELPVCTDSGTPELGMTLRSQSLVEGLAVSLSTCDALCQMPGEQAEERGTVYAKEKGARWDGTTSELWRHV